MAQGTFRNLDFELANVPDLAPGQYGSLNGTPAADALPYWTAYYGTNQTALVTHNSYTLGSVNISILGPQWDNSLGTIIEGKYTAVLQAGSPQHYTAAIAQTGLIPATAHSIQMRVNPFGGYVLGVTFGGRDVPTVILAKNSFNDWLVGGDISAFAGQTGELRLTALSNPDFYFGSFGVDSIVFSDNPIPEPSTFILGLACGSVFALRLWLRKR